MTGPDSASAERFGDEEEFGALKRGADEVTVRFVRRLLHPPAKVWRALEPPAVMELMWGDERLRFELNRATARFVAAGSAHGPRLELLDG